MRTLLGGRIGTVDGAGFDCVIRNLGDTDATLVCEGRVDVPDVFSLLLVRARARSMVRVVWRRGEEIGVRVA